MSGEPRMMLPIPVRCRCRKQPCEYILPDDWIVTALDLQSPALQPLLQPVSGSEHNAAMAALPWHFAHGRDREVMLAFLRKSRVTMPEPGAWGGWGLFDGACALSFPCSFVRRAHRDSGLCGSRLRTLSVA